MLHTMSSSSVFDDDDDLNTRRSSCSYPFSPFTDGIPRLSFSYHKLPPQLIKLSVVKLDNSSFDVQVNGNATVGELKEAVEDVFVQSPKDGGAKPISWSHVWGHFCLCYEGQKLINDRDYIRNCGIKDGDKLQFIRHLSINYMKRIPRREKITCKESPWPHAIPEEGSDDYVYNDRPDESPSTSSKERSAGFVCNDQLDEGSGSDQGDKDGNGDLHKKDSKYYNHDKDEDFIGQQEFKLAHYLKGWLAYSTLWFTGKTKSDCKSRPSRFSGHFLKLGSRVRLTSL